MTRLETWCDDLHGHECPVSYCISYRNQPEAKLPVDLSFWGQEIGGSYMCVNYQIWRCLFPTSGTPIDAFHDPGSSNLDPLQLRYFYLYAECHSPCGQAL